MNFLIPQSQIPVLSIADFRKELKSKTLQEQRISAYFGNLEGENIKIYCVLANDRAGTVSVVSTSIPLAERSYESLASEIVQIHWFERELYEDYGVVPKGHPWLKPIRFKEGFVPDMKEHNPIGDTSFYHIEGTETHEVAVGPVHAGVIEPGHFRFLCHGETVFHLEISLGYQHRGIEKNFFGGPFPRTLFAIETMAGDTTIGHALAYCRNMESLAKLEVPARARILRLIMLELERIANHVGDLGAIANDVGYLPTASYCGRLRGDILNLTCLVCGNRFGRSMLFPGGVHHDIEDRQISTFLSRLSAAYKDIEGATYFLWNSPSLLSRLEQTGTVFNADAREIGLVGPAGRACEIKHDVRKNYPDIDHAYENLAIAFHGTGDVFARAYVRWLEIQSSTKFIENAVKNLPEGKIGQKAREITLAPQMLSVSLTEGWRGEICHVALTDEKGKFSHYKVVDPSFHNWFGLALALRNEEISNFPLCNKSFNLSYCGHDL